HYLSPHSSISLFFFNATPTTEIYTLSLHDALPIFSLQRLCDCRERRGSNSAGSLDMISSQPYFTSATKTARTISRPLPFSLRSNRKINGALRAAYLKFDRTAETAKLVGKHLPR